MKAVGYIQHIDRLLSDDFQIRPPHVAADNVQPCTALFAKPSGKYQRSVDGSLLHPPKASASLPYQFGKPRSGMATTGYKGDLQGILTWGFER
jgi:hypothetical protein